MQGKKIRTWTGRFKWAGKKEFRAGTVTVVLPVDTPHHEILKAVEAEFVKFWADILPDHFERPVTIALEPGAIFFSGDDDA